MKKSQPNIAFNIPSATSFRRRYSYDINFNICEKSTIHSSPFRTKDCKRIQTIKETRTFVVSQFSLREMWNSAISHLNLQYSRGMGISFREGFFSLSDKWMSITFAAVGGRRKIIFHCSCFVSYSFKYYIKAILFLGTECLWWNKKNKECGLSIF